MQNSGTAPLLRVCFSAATLAVFLGYAPAYSVAQAAPQPTPPASGPVVSSGVGSVSLPVFVVDDKGNPVRNLKSSDLKLSDNGSAQTIQSFGPATTEPITYGLIGQVGSGMREELGDERLASVRFVDHSLPGTTNKFFVIQYADEVDLQADPTAAQDKLHDALNQLGSRELGNTGDSGTGGSTDSGQSSSGQNSSAPHFGDVHGGTLYDAIYLASNEVMKKQPGQHILILVTDGIDHSSKESINDAVEAAQSAHAAVFAIYFKPEAEPVRRDNNQSPRQRGGMGPGFPGGGGGYPGGSPGGGRRGGEEPTEQQPHEDGRQNLIHICNATGGYMVESKRDKADEAYAKIAALIHNQYTLTFVPTKDATQSAYQRISLTAEKKGVYPLVQEGFTGQQ